MYISTSRHMMERMQITILLGAANILFTVLRWVRPGRKLDLCWIAANVPISILVPGISQALL